MLKIIRNIANLFSVLQLLGIFLLLLFGCQPLESPKTDLSPPPGAELFKSKCSNCHAPELALREYRSESVWRDTILRMKQLHKADITKKEIELLVKYHVERQEKEAVLFKEKCEICHPGKVFLEQKLTPDQARSVIKRMQQKAGNTIEDKDIEIIIRYHVQAQQAALEKSFGNITRQITGDKPLLDRQMTLFVEKCSACHEPSRALSVLKDPEVWSQTIKRMQSYSKGAITDAEAAELVDFHVSRQQEELNTFQQTCTRCHDDERINSRSMSDEQWLAIIKRMQQKAPELITDEKISLLAAYFHRRELSLAKIFYDKCPLCHFNIAGQALSAASPKPLDGLIASANKEFGEGLRLGDIGNLLSLHVQRQKRNMQLYENNCTACHPDRSAKGNEAAEGKPAVRSRAEWVFFIAALQGIELTKETQSLINSQIDFHISRY